MVLVFFEFVEDLPFENERSVQKWRTKVGSRLFLACLQMAFVKITAF